MTEAEFEALKPGDRLVLADPNRRITSIFEHIRGKEVIVTRIVADNIYFHLADEPKEYDSKSLPKSGCDVAVFAHNRGASAMLKQD